MKTSEIKDYVGAALRQLRAIPDVLISQEGYTHLSSDGVISPSVVGLSKDELRNLVLKNIPAASTFSGTFYKTWHEVVSLKADELYANAVLHYISTYGVETVFGTDTNIEENYLHLPQGFIPRELETHPELFKLFIVRTTSRAEFIKLLENTIYKGLALKQSTVKDLVLLAELYEIPIGEDEVKNKETLTYLQAEANCVPEDPEQTIRLLNFIATGDTTIVQDKEHIGKIRRGFIWTTQNKELAERILKENQRQLATVFYRYKKLILALKKAGYAKEVNKIRRMANKLWEPKSDKNNFLISKILSEDETVSLSDLPNHSIETLVKVYNKLAYIAQAYREQGCYQEIYTIRNGRYFVKTEPKRLTAVQYNNITIARDTLLGYLRDTLNHDGIAIELPKGIDLAFPASEKSFIGEIPLYSQIKLEEGASTIGISWTKDDIDLSGITQNGEKVGWNGHYNNLGVLYSGDCTRGGAEALYLTKNNKVMVMVNLFNTDKNELNMFFSTQDQNRFEMFKGKAYEPTDVVYTTQLHLENKSQMLGVYDKAETSTFTFANLSHGNSNVSSNSKLVQTMIDVLILRGKTALKVRDIFPERTDETHYLSLGSDNIIDKSKILALVGDYSDLLIEEDEA